MKYAPAYDEKGFILFHIRHSRILLIGHPANISYRTKVRYFILVLPDGLFLFGADDVP